MKVFAPESTGGDDITTYELWRDQGATNSAFEKVESYGLAGGDTG